MSSPGLGCHLLLVLHSMLTMLSAESHLLKAKRLPEETVDVSKLQVSHSQNAYALRRPSTGFGKIIQHSWVGIIGAWPKVPSPLV